MLWILWVYLGIAGLVFLGYQAFFWYVKLNGSTPVLFSDVWGAILTSTLFGALWPIATGFFIYTSFIAK